MNIFFHTYRKRIEEKYRINLDEIDLIESQRKIRSAIMDEYIGANHDKIVEISRSTQMTMGAHIFGEVKLLNLQKYERVKRQSKRDVRNYERELRARKTQIDSYQRDRRRDFHSALMQHSVNFYKFHREKENERRKIVKAGIYMFVCI